MADSRQPLNPATWPRKVEKHCQIIPTICFNCEAACGLVAVVEKETNVIRRFEGNPEHPGSRGRNCAKGPATLNQVTDPERIRYPLKRMGKRGEGKWERVSWDEVLDDIAGRVRKALQEERRNEIMYHVGRPGHELLYHQRIFHRRGHRWSNQPHQRLFRGRPRRLRFLVRHRSSFAGSCQCAL